MSVQGTIGLNVMEPLKVFNKLRREKETRRLKIERKDGSVFVSFEIGVGLQVEVHVGGTVVVSVERSQESQADLFGLALRCARFAIDNLA